MLQRDTGLKQAAVERIEPRTPDKVFRAGRDRKPYGECGDNLAEFELLLVCCPKCAKGNCHDAHTLAIARESSADESWGDTMFTKLATAFVFIFALSACSSGVGLPSGKDSPGAEESVNCQDGTSLIVFEEAFYAVTGSTIRKPADAPLQDTEDYSKAFTAGSGE